MKHWRYDLLLLASHEVATRLFNRFAKMDQYIALSKKDITLNITLNEIYNTHALLIQHRDILVYLKYIVQSLRRGVALMCLPFFDSVPATSIISVSA